MGKTIGKGYCPECDKDVNAAAVDFGIGPYEYWGARGVHRDIHICCEECDEPLEDFDEIEPDYFDRFNEDEDYFDRYNEDEHDR